MPYIEDREIMAINNMFAAEMFNKLDIPPLYEFKTEYEAHLAYQQELNNL